MIESIEQSDLELVRSRINGETAKIPWKSLQRFFASGKTLHVESSLDLVEVACFLHEDKVDQVREWLDAGRVSQVTDEQARHWIETDSMVWAVVVKPWVLVQSSD